MADDITDLVFDAWLDTVAFPPTLPDNIDDMGTYNKWKCDQIKGHDPRLRTLTDQELLGIINGW